MSGYEFKIVPAPRKGLGRALFAKDPSAMNLAEAVNTLADEGWTFLRSDTLLSGANPAVLRLDHPPPCAGVPPAPLPPVVASVGARAQQARKRAQLRGGFRGPAWRLPPAQRGARGLITPRARERGRECAP